MNGVGSDGVVDVYGTGARDLEGGAGGANDAECSFLAVSA